MFEGFELVEEEHDYIVVDNEQALHKRNKIVVNNETKRTIHPDYEKLLHENKIIYTQLKKKIYEMEEAGVTGNNKKIWLAAATCLNKCMSDLIDEGDKLIKKTIVPSISK